MLSRAESVKSFLFVVADIGGKRLEVVQKMVQIPMEEVVLVDSG